MKFLVQKGTRKRQQSLTIYRRRRRRRRRHPLLRHRKNNVYGRGLRRSLMAFTVSRQLFHTERISARCIFVDINYKMMIFLLFIRMIQFHYIFKTP